MNEQFIEISTAAGKMETFVTRPQQDAPFAPVILYMDVWGVREVLYDLARRIATVGYYVVVPDLYYRQGRIRTNFRDAQGRAISLKNLDAASREKALAPQKNMTDGQVMEDTGDILEFLKTEKAVTQGPVGSIGYCMGGRHVLQAAARYPGRFKATACLHGTTIISDKPDSPHRFVKDMRGEVYCGFAETDQYAPLPMVAEWNELMKSCGAKYRYEIHSGAEHGYALPDRDLFHKAAAERDWELIFPMYRRQLSS